MTVRSLLPELDDQSEDPAGDPGESQGVVLAEYRVECIKHSLYRDQRYTEARLTLAPLLNLEALLVRRWVTATSRSSMSSHRRSTSFTTTGPAVLEPPEPWSRLRRRGSCVVVCVPGSQAQNETSHAHRRVRRDLRGHGGPQRRRRQPRLPKSGIGRRLEQRAHVVAGTAQRLHRRDPHQVLPAQVEDLRAPGRRGHLGRVAAQALAAEEG